jgi:hypothetical protein
MFERFLFDAEISDISQLERVHNIFDLIDNVENLLGNEVKEELLDSVWDIKKNACEVEIAINGLRTVFFASQRRSDGVLWGFIPEDSSYNELVGQDGVIMSENRAALEGGLGDRKKIEIRYLNDTFKHEAERLLGDVDDYLR